MADISKCQECLLGLAAQKGYLTFDDILNASEAFSLSVTEVDFLSEAIQLRGIIVYETAPDMEQTLQIDEDVLDYSRTDYSAIYREIIEIAPQMATLINEIKTFPAPQWGETILLAKQISEGNKFARDRLIKLYMRNVLKIALSMTKQYDLDLEEAVSGGFIGLINGVDKYDPSGFSAFHSYVSLWIQQGIQRECNPIWFKQNYPSHTKEKLLRVLQKYNLLSTGEDMGSKGFDKTIKNISEITDIPSDEVMRLLQRIVTQKEAIDFSDILDADRLDLSCFPETLIMCEESVFKGVFEEELRCVLNKILSQLRDREQKVIVLRFGLADGEPKTLETVGNMMGVTRERVRQIETKAIKKLNLEKNKKTLIAFRYT